MKYHFLPAVAACAVAGVLANSAVLTHFGDESTATAGGSSTAMTKRTT